MGKVHRIAASWKIARIEKIDSTVLFLSLLFQSF
uniref:Uncharacterized protein n=1 Tax=Arundo donax TaxID=35708 RepID=A0A0A9H384_ARUDO